MKKHLILLVVLLCSQLSMAEDLAPTKARIIAQKNGVAWVKFIDNSDGDFFRFYFDGKTNSSIKGDIRDTPQRNGKSRVIPFNINGLSPKTYKEVTIGVIKNNKKVAESVPFILTMLKKNKAPTISKVFKGSKRYTWVKFIDHSDGDLFRFYFNGEVNHEAIKDYKDTASKNGKSRVVPINMTKLAPNSKFHVTIGVIKDGKKIAESQDFIIETGDVVDLEAKVIKYNKEHGVRASEFDYARATFYFDEHFAQVKGGNLNHRDLYNFYRIDDNNNIKLISTIPFMELDPTWHEHIRLDPYDNNRKLRLIENQHESETLRCSYYDMHDLDNIEKIGEVVIENGDRCSNHDM